MQKAILALGATLLLILGALVLVWPELRQNATLIHLVVITVMCGAAIVGMVRTQNRRLPAPWAGIKTTGLGRLNLVALAGALITIALGFALPTRFQPEGTGWSWLTMGFVGYAWLFSQLRLERYGVPKESGRSGKD